MRNKFKLIVFTLTVCLAIASCSENKNESATTEAYTVKTLADNEAEIQKLTKDFFTAIIQYGYTYADSMVVGEAKVQLDSLEVQMPTKPTPPDIFNYDMSSIKFVDGQHAKSIAVLSNYLDFHFEYTLVENVWKISWIFADYDSMIRRLEQEMNASNNE